MNRRWRILVGANVPPDANSGAAGTVVETCRALVEAEQQVEAFWAADIGRRIKHGNLHNLLELPVRYRQIVRQRMARRPFDVIQLSQPHGYLAGKWVLAQPNRPLMVWRSHGLEAKVDDALARFTPDKSGVPVKVLRASVRAAFAAVQRSAMRWSDGAIVPCQDDKDVLVERFGAEPERVRVIWHGVPGEYIDLPMSDDPARWRRLLHVSQLSVNKGAVLMQRQAGEILRHYREATMTWVCPISMHGQVRESLPDDVRERVELIDWMDREKLILQYDRHGIFLFPTLAEGAAKVVMEAMARGMCVVSSNTSGPRDYIRDGHNGVLVPVGRAECMAQAAIRLLMNASDCLRMGVRAKETAAAFRWSRCARQVTEFYSDLEAKKGMKLG